MGHREALSALSVIAALSGGLLAGCAPESSTPSVEHLRAEVIERLPFDQTSFTQGLEVTADGNLYVGTGQEGESRLYTRTVAGEELASVDLDPQFFGEGITRIDDTLWQLTWLDGTAIRRNAETLEEIGRASYQGEGWGLCSRPEANEVIFSDGTEELRRMDPETLEERERFTVTLDGEPVAGLNELECVGNDVYANVFTTTDIVRIDAETGEVTARIDASALPNNATDDPNHVLNGIAHIPGTDEFFLAGKRWPDMYRVRFAQAD
ncbi:glutamine cyclotransferase [Corynebacterium sp. HMSC034E11]|uniref:glutaminyl-peptide cyclotransferase n=1 Tax=Corynebacterium sp. HMSC034E11 TaxID=1715169 RepID=UPI0008A89E5E|nr:glutaminyl-peptide cyclotransferase [Corynebacterium sp. HMSC034E11]OHO33794.1 glutamine cyclotransferase [Corynebacterium sp. HMSC034E11]